MKFFKILFLLLFVVILGGLVWLAFTDVPVRQSEMVIDIPNDRFFEEN